MYTPNHFRIDDVTASHQIIEENPFGILMSSGVDEAPTASHLPFHLDRKVGTLGTLHVHLARANDQAKVLDGAMVRCVFSGPHAYLSPTWYGSSPAVPTWNYVAVHCIGRARRVEDARDMEHQMAVLSSRYEADGPWQFDNLPDDFRRGMLKGIVGYTIEIADMIGKAKLSQNKSVEITERSAEGLRKTGRHDDSVIADMMLSSRDTTK